jgi:hypothetical protein
LSASPFGGGAGTVVSGGVVPAATKPKVTLAPTATLAL